MRTEVPESPGVIASMSTGATIPAAVAVLIRVFILIIGAYALVHLAPEASRTLVVLTISVVFPLLIVMLWTVVHWRVMRRFVRGDATVVRDDSEMLSRYGIDNVRIVVTPGGHHIGWCYRRGRQVLISVAALPGDPAAFRFVVAHEAGHAIRNDSTRRRVGFSVAVSLMYGALFSFDYRLIAATVIAVAVWTSVSVSLAEIACDRIAVRTVGSESIESFAASYRELLRQPANRTPGMRVRRAIGVFTHPPMSWRLALAKRTLPMSAVVAEPLPTSA